MSDETLQVWVVVWFLAAVWILARHWRGAQVPLISRLDEDELSKVPMISIVEDDASVRERAAEFSRVNSRAMWGF